MALIPTDMRLQVEKAIEDKQIKQDLRPYLGISSIGDKCARKLWYGFRLCSREKITPRQNRLFSRGHREEPIITADLQAIGVIHHSDQKEVTFCNGHGKGHCDGILERVPDAPKTPHLAEYKTHNNKSFSDLKAKKSVKNSKPVHYDQMICYMDKLELKRGLYIAVNKDNDERYYERISENPKRAAALFSRADRIISTEEPPPRIGGPEWFECKWCDHYYVCHFGNDPIKTCRSCQHVAICDDGKWECDKHQIELAFGQQKLACKFHCWMLGLQKREG